MYLKIVFSFRDAKVVYQKGFDKKQLIKLIKTMLFSNNQNTN